MGIHSIQQEKSRIQEEVEHRKREISELAKKPYGEMPDNLHSVFTGSEDLFYLMQLQKQYTKLK
jgi:predicted nuclease with TOPRIM domain